MAKEFIVAIELGSSKITGIAGRRNIDGSISVLSVVSEDSTQCIRKGVIYNIDKTCSCLKTIIKRLSTQLRCDISRVYVGVSGQSLRSVRNVIVKDLPTEEVVTQLMVDEMMDTNRTMTYPDQEILYAAIQEYKVGQQYHLDPIGIPCKRLEGNILNILWRKKFYKNLNYCFDTAGIPIAEMLLTPLMLADNVLTDAERRTGCLLVDLGSDTTTVLVYHKNILRHLAVIPLGGSNVTKDITSLQIDDTDAERIKLEYSSAWTDTSDISDNQTIQIENDRSIEKRQFVEVVEARVREIIENVWHQVPSDFTDKLLGGVILTGGGSNMRNIEKAFKTILPIDKIRIAHTVNFDISSNDPAITAHDARMNSVLSLLIKGDLNCAGKELKEDGELFDENDKTENDDEQADHTIKPRQLGETDPGVVRTEREVKAADEIINRNGSQQADDINLNDEESGSTEEKGVMNKIIKSVKKFLKQVVDDKVE